MLVVVLPKDGLSANDPATRARIIIPITIGTLAMVGIAARES